MRLRSFIRMVCGAAAVLTSAGCISSTRTPDRLYPIIVEMDAIRSTQESLVRQYYETVPSARAAAIRNEIVAQRMYAIDIQYTEYETALTREVQEVGFAALTSAEGLTTASTLIANVATKSILSATATAVLATRGHYNSEILLAQTIRTIQKQMRASRNTIATNIAAKINLTTAEYPLAAALSDVEDYYNAGTLTTGVIDTSTTVGTQELESKGLKQIVTQAPAEMRATIVRNAIIDSATAPIVVQPPLADRNPGGPTAFERKATPAQIAEMESVTCQPKRGKITDALRQAVLAKVNRPDGTGITSTDFIRINVEFNAIKNGTAKSKCN